MTCNVQASPHKNIQFIVKTNEKIFLNSEGETGEYWYGLENVLIDLFSHQKLAHSFSDYQLINCLPRDGFLCLVLLIRFIIIILHALLELIAFFLSIFFLLKNCAKRFFPLILHFAKGSIIISENEEILKFPCFSFYLYLNVFKLYLLLKSLHFSAHSFLCFRSTISIFLFGSLSSWFLCLLITTLIFFF